MCEYFFASTHLLYMYANRFPRLVKPFFEGGTNLLVLAFYSKTTEYFIENEKAKFLVALMWNLEP